jgi:hypothetical protein
LPLVIGEFNDKHSSHVNDICVISDIDARSIISECQKNGIWVSHGVARPTLIMIFDTLICLILKVGVVKIDLAFVDLGYN